MSEPEPLTIEFKVTFPGDLADKVRDACREYDTDPVTLIGKVISNVTRDGLFDIVLED